MSQNSFVFADRRGFSVTFVVVGFVVAAIVFFATGFFVGQNEKFDFFSEVRDSNGVVVAKGVDCMAVDICSVAASIPTVVSVVDQVDGSIVLLSESVNSVDRELRVEKPVTVCVLDQMNVDSCLLVRCVAAVLV